MDTNPNTNPNTETDTENYDPDSVYRQTLSSITHILEKSRQAYQAIPFNFETVGSERYHLAKSVEIMLPHLNEEEAMRVKWSINSLFDSSHCSRHSRLVREEDFAD